MLISGNVTTCSKEHAKGNQEIPHLTNWILSSNQSSYCTQHYFTSNTFTCILMGLQTEQTQESPIRNHFKKLTTCHDILQGLIWRKKTETNNQPPRPFISRLEYLGGEIRKKEQVNTGALYIKVNTGKLRCGSYFITPGQIHPGRSNWEHPNQAREYTPILSPGH